MATDRPAMLTFAAAAAAPTTTGAGSGESGVGEGGGAAVLTFPRIFVGGVLLGGHEQLREAAGSGALFGALVAAGVPLQVCCCCCVLLLSSRQQLQRA